MADRAIRFWMQLLRRQRHPTASNYNHIGVNDIKGARLCPAGRRLLLSMVRALNRGIYLQAFLGARQFFFSTDSLSPIQPPALPGD